MADTTDKKVEKFSGKPLSEEELKEWQQTFVDIEESIELVMKEGEDL